MSYETAPATVMLATDCAICARPLVDAESVERGMGPHCAQKYGANVASITPRFNDAALVLGTLDMSIAPVWRTGNAHACVNALVSRIALDRHGANVATFVTAVHLLGFAKLAATLAEKTCGRVDVTLDGSTLVVDAPFSAEFNEAIRTVRGARWCSQSKRRLVPVDARKELFAILKHTHKGAILTGPKGMVTL